MLGADILIILLLILINGFFVGAEIAFVSVRRTRLDELAEEGDRRAKRAQKLMRDPGRFLAVIRWRSPSSGHSPPPLPPSAS